MNLRFATTAPVVTLALALLAGCGDNGGTTSAAPNSIAAVAAPSGQDWTQVVSKELLRVCTFNNISVNGVNVH